VRLVAFPSRPGTQVRAWMRSPRFRAKNVSTCTRSPTARGSSHASHSSWDDVAFSSTERDRHLEIRPVSQLNTWPVVAPVNASRRPSRDAAHHSGSGRMASPFPVGDFHLLFFASFSWRTPLRVTGCLPECSSATAAVAQIAADLLHGASRQPWASSRPVMICWIRSSRSKCREILQASRRSD
jgi:hypothetical protein